MKQTLKDIFGNVNSSKFSNIERYFEEHEVYTADDLTLFDLGKIAGKSDIFSDLDVEKIKNYTKKGKLYFEMQKVDKKSFNYFFKLLIIT